MAYSPYKKSKAIQNHSSNKSEETVKLFASMMIERMEALKNENWRKGWFNGVSFQGIPENYSGRTYNAGNAFMLNLFSSIKNYSVPVFLTFKQAMDNDLKIKKGAKAFPVVYWDFTIKDQNGNKISYLDYRRLDKEEQKNYNLKPFLKEYYVFNVDQTNLQEVNPEKYQALKDKFKLPEIKDGSGMYVHNALDKMIQEQSWYCPIKADRLSDSAFYSPSADIIVVPQKEQFKTHNTKEDIYTDGMEFYSTLLHEMTHSTGSPDRLNREKGGKFGDDKYAKEELVAELTAAMIGNTMGFDSSITDNSAKYLDSWVATLKENPNFIISVLADVNKAAEMILDKVDEQRLALGETPYLSKNMVAVDKGYSLEPEFKPVQELIANEPINSYSENLDPGERVKLNDSLSQQFNEMKAKHPDVILLFRVGDFYETFKEDAADVSNILGITLTKSSREGGMDICGFPHNALDNYLPKLIHAGKRVAICEPASSLNLTKPLVKRGVTEEKPKVKSYNEVSKTEQQKRERILIKEWSGENTVSIIQSYQKKYEPKGKIFQEGELPVAHSLLFQGLINYHQFYASASPKEYAQFCLSNELVPGYVSAKQLWKNNSESGRANAYMFPSTGEILHQRELIATTLNSENLKIQTVKAICLNIPNPAPFLNDLEKKGLISQKERNKVDELLNKPLEVNKKEEDLNINFKNEDTMAKKKKSEEPVAEKKDKVKLTQKQLEELPVGSKIEFKAKDGSVATFTKETEKGWNIKDQWLNSKWGGDHEDTLKYIKETHAGKEMKIIPAVAEKQDQKNEQKKEELEIIKITNKQLEKLPVGSKIEVTNKNSGEITTFIKSDKNGWDKMDTGTGKRTPVADHDNVAFILNDKYANKDFSINIIPGVKQTEKQEVKAEETKQEVVKQPKEPQMVTVNGDKVTGGHTYIPKNNQEEHFFIAKLNGEYLRRVKISKEMAEDFASGKVSLPEMMEKCYPTKVMPKLSDEEFKNGKFVEGKNIEQFNVFKENKKESENYGKYMFYARVDGKHMWEIASQNDLNAYFDKVKTPAQIVENVFGEKLQLKSHYERFTLPEGMDPKEIKITKNQQSNQYMIYLDMGEAGKSKGKFMSYEDTNSFFEKKATREQLGAKYLSEEINNRMGMKTENKQEVSTKMKL